MVAYENYEERAERDWATYFWFAYATPHGSPERCTVRLYPTMDRAEMSQGQNCRYLFGTPEELATKFDGAQMMAAFRTLRSTRACKTSLVGAVEGPHCDDLPDDLRFNRSEMSERLWALIQEVADRVRSISLINELDEDLFVIRLDRMTNEEGLATIGAYNRQKQIVANGLIEFGKSKATELELTEMMRDLVTRGILKTKQEPMRIFKYYAPELGDDGFLFYPTKRHKREDHAQNV